MQSKPAKRDFIDLAKLPGPMGREDCQDGWHRLVASLGLGTVLDVGSGVCLAKYRMPFCTTQDPADVGADVRTPVEETASDCYDAVTAFDVIEHVVEDVTFLEHLCRIARKWVFVTTPNLNVSHAANGCHCREYDPREFAALFTNCVLFAGDGRGLKTRQLPLAEFLLHGEPHQAAWIKLEKR